MRRRVKITGIGPVTPAGIGREPFTKGIRENVSRTRELKNRIPPQFGRFLGAEIPDFHPEQWLPPDVNARKLPRQTQFALVGAALALSDAGLSAGMLSNIRCLIAVGSTIPDPELTVQLVTSVVEKGPRYATPRAFLEAPPSATVKHLVDFLNVSCESMAFQSDCCAGLDAFGYAAEKISWGEVDIALAIGTDAPLFHHPLLELGKARLSPSNIEAPEMMGKPFDLWRNSGVIGEGAAAFILEAEGSPRPPLAWIGGIGRQNDEPGDGPVTGLSHAIRRALANASIQPEAIDCIYAWGPGHSEVDRAEAACLAGIFGDRIGKIPAVSIKGAIGNPLAAAGTIQAASAVISLESGIIPPTVNWERKDPEILLNLSGATRHGRCSTVLVNSHGSSGPNTSVVLLK